MDRRVVTSSGVVKVSRLASRLWRSARLHTYRDDYHFRDTQLLLYINHPHSACEQALPSLPLPLPPSAKVHVNNHYIIIVLALPLLLLPLPSPSPLLHSLIIIIAIIATAVTIALVIIIIARWDKPRELTSYAGHGYENYVGGSQG